MYQTLRFDNEQLPQWLKEFHPGKSIDLRKILSHRVLFYPGAGNDGQPIEAFNSTHTVHTYLYSDYSMDIAETIKMLKEDKIKGYTLLSIISLDIAELLPKGIVADICDVDDHGWNKTCPLKFCMVCIYEREPGYGDFYGAERFALVYTNEDAYRVFNIVYHPTNHLPAPYAIVLQEHGTGGNYDRWGRGGLLERIAERHNIFPNYYIIAVRNTKPWSRALPAHDRVMYGGMHKSPRELYVDIHYEIPINHRRM